MQKIKSILGNNSFGDEALMLWKEYVDDGTVEAKFVKDLDKLELIFQAIEYEKSKINNFLCLWLLLKNIFIFFRRRNRFRILDFRIKGQD